MSENLRLFEKVEKFNNPEDIITIDHRTKDKESTDYDCNNISIDESISKN